MSDFSTALTVFNLLGDAHDEGELEYVLLSAADSRLTAPVLDLSHGRGVVKAAKANEKHAGADYKLLTYKQRTISGISLRKHYAQAPQVINYRTTRKRNPESLEESIIQVVSVARLSLLTKSVLGLWYDPKNEELYKKLTSRQRLGRHFKLLSNLSTHDHI